MGKKKKWQCEYEDYIFKIYDWDNKLAGYFFPNYGIADENEEFDRIVTEMNKRKENVDEGHLMLPLAKINIFDNNNLDIQNLYNILEINLERIKFWKEWLETNKDQFNIKNDFIQTSREDRNMLSITLNISKSFVLEKNNILQNLEPILDGLHQYNLL